MSRFTRAIVVVVLCALGCEKDEPCLKTTLPALQQYSFLDPNRYQAVLQNVDQSAVQINLIIRNQQDYEKYLLIMPDTTRPVIDFSKRMLLAGHVREGTSASVDSMSIASTCEGYTLNVFVNQGNLGVVQFVPYYFLCDITDRQIKVKVIDN